MPDIEIIHSEDGSHTLRSKRFGVTYHSLHGAIEEAIHIFIAAGLNYFPNKEKISIFEMGFGSGLNAWLSALYSYRNKQTIEYTGIEFYPLGLKECLKLNYPSQIPVTDIEAKYFQQLHTTTWNKKHDMHASFSYCKIEDDILQYEFDAKYDIIFFDAFGPNTQSELWELPLHEKIYQSLNPGGILITYCAKGSFKRMLQSLGYTLDKLKGPGRKHEMTRAIK